MFVAEKVLLLLVISLTAEVGLFIGNIGQLGNSDSGNNLVQNRQHDITWKYNVSV